MEFTLIGDIRYLKYFIFSVRNIVTTKDDAVREEKKLQAVSSYKHGSQMS